MNPIILHTYTLPITDNQRPTMHFVADLKDNGYPIYSYEMKEPNDYENLLKRFWRTVYNPVITLERDNVPTQDMIEKLFWCPYSLCAQAYLIHNQDRYTHRDSQGTDTVIFHNSTQRMEFASHVGLGLTKFGSERWDIDINNIAEQLEDGSVQFLINGELSDGRAYQTFDSRLCNLFWEKRKRFHIHWPEMEHTN